MFVDVVIGGSLKKRGGGRREGRDLPPVIKVFSQALNLHTSIGRERVLEERILFYCGCNAIQSLY